MIDLHTHTKYSDGTDDIKEYLKKAENQKLSAISITDHNTCKAYDELEKINVEEYYSGDIITGVELNTKVLSIPIEVLGYKIDTKKMQKLIDENYITNEERSILEVRRLEECCMKADIILPIDFVEKYDHSMWPSKYLHKFITKNSKNQKYIEKDAWEDSNVFYRKYMSNPNTMFYINMDDVLPDFKKVTKMIKEAGGLVFIPHIFEYRDNSEKILEYILKNYEIDGIECYYTTFSEIQTKRLLKICKERNLLISGGSDYHGKNKVGVEIGIGRGNLKIKTSIIKNW